jgi:restriction system protein
MTDEVKAMIEATVRELTTRWQEAGGRRQEPSNQQSAFSTQKGTVKTFSPRMNADDTDLKGSNQYSAISSQPNMEETINAGYQELKKQVRAELLARIRAGSAKFFERMVVELMVRLGYGGALENPGTVTGQSGDEGIDGVVQQDRLGLEFLYIQAKCWNHDVSRDEIQKFVGALHGKRASKGVFVTTSSFTKSAVEFAARS